MSINLIYDCDAAIDSGEYNKPCIVVQSMGIKYKQWIASSVGRVIEIIDCDNIPDDLPSYITVNRENNLETLKARNAQLLEALTKAHEILLHEMDNGRTPTMLQGVGLGYFEDVIAGLDHPKQRG